MKIRNDFVTNSSSTSFILSMRKVWNKKNFMSAIGVEGESPMNLLFEELFEVVDRNKRNIKAVMNDEKMTDEKAFLERNGYKKETIDRVMQLIDEGRSVYYGKLSTDDGNAVEAYFSTESFLFCDDEIYFNGKIGVY